jgi:hypothetical protein
MAVPLLAKRLNRQERIAPSAASHRRTTPMPPIFQGRRKIPGTDEGDLVRVFDRRDFVFDSELLALPVGDLIGIGIGAVGFEIDGFLQASVPGPEGFDTILCGHGSS